MKTLRLPLDHGGAAAGPRHHPRRRGLRPRPGTPHPFEQDDLVLAEELAARAAVCVDNARRYTRERSTAAHPAAQPAAQRMPRAGSRRGRATATCRRHRRRRRRRLVRRHPAVRRPGRPGRRRRRRPRHPRLARPWDGCAPRYAPSPTSTCPRTNCSPTWTTWSPAHRPGRRGRRRPRERPATSARTCLYAVYDPVSRVCTLASAGHPPPVAGAPRRHRPHCTTHPRPAARRRRPALRVHRAGAARGQPCSPSTPTA